MMICKHTRVWIQMTHEKSTVQFKEVTLLSINIFTNDKLTVLARS